MFRKKKTKKVVHDIPRNLEELGYQINEKGQFLTLKGKQVHIIILIYVITYVYANYFCFVGEIYNFEVREKERAYNEALYDVIIGNLLLFT